MNNVYNNRLNKRLVKYSKKNKKQKNFRTRKRKFLSKQNKTKKNHSMRITPRPFASGEREKTKFLTWLWLCVYLSHPVFVMFDGEVFFSSKFNRAWFKKNYDYPKYMRSVQSIYTTVCLWWKMMMMIHLIIIKIVVCVWVNLPWQWNDDHQYK